MTYLCLDLRTCAFCGEQEFVYRDGSYLLFKYSTRRYAHGACLLKAKGADGLALLPVHLLKAFPFRIAKDAGLENELIFLVERVT